jgi:hypothetical protein
LNIFFLDLDTKLSAQAHVDKHVVKMILEYAQLLSTTHQLTRGGRTDVYKATHKNHPSAKWTRASSENYRYLYQLWSDLHDEYMFRYKKGHKSFLELSERLKDPPVNLPTRKLLPPFLALPEPIKSNFRDPLYGILSNEGYIYAKPYTFSDGVEAYRWYYRDYKQHLHSWKYRSAPSWI